MFTFGNPLESVDGESPISIGAPGMNRTCDLRFRKPSLYPLSYGGGDGAKCGAKLTITVCAVVCKATDVRTTQKVLQKSKLDSVILEI